MNNNYILKGVSLVENYISPGNKSSQNLLSSPTSSPLSLTLCGSLAEAGVLAGLDAPREIADESSVCSVMSSSA